MRIKAKTNYDRTIDEIRGHYEQLVDSSNKLRIIVEKTQQDLDGIMNKKIGTSSPGGEMGPEGDDLNTIYVKSGGDLCPDECPCYAKVDLKPTKEKSKSTSKTLVGKTNSNEGDNSQTTKWSPSTSAGSTMVPSAMKGTKHAALLANSIKMEPTSSNRLSEPSGSDANQVRSATGSDTNRISSMTGSNVNTLSTATSSKTNKLASLSGSDTNKIKSSTSDSDKMPTITEVQSKINKESHLVNEGSADLVVTPQDSDYHRKNSLEKSRNLFLANLKGQLDANNTKHKRRTSVPTGSKLKAQNRTVPLDLLQQINADKNSVASDNQIKKISLSAIESTDDQESFIFSVNPD
ncbi:serine-rich adhesin for platelets-like isoform X2 [Anthonomus grandis grandis]|nr:serine-rich adhesin for platelets-like isoform X2 [Anthonomus grandis grandis]